jgi:fatty aldehyde-generating acyl-ACP reductase
MLPFLTRDSPWFSFIGHPRHLLDLEHIGGTALLRRYSVNEEDFLEKIGLIPPLVIGHVSFHPIAITGEVIAVMCMPPLMSTPHARIAVLEAIRLAVSRGSRLIGLGALTAPATGGGLSVIKDIPRGVTLTTGNAFTAVVAFHNVVEASNLINNTPHIAVLGCTGSVGFAVSHLLARAGYQLTLIGRNIERVRTLFNDLNRKAKFAHSLSALKKANIVLALTNDSTAKICPEMLCPESVVIDVAQPANINPSDYFHFQNRGIYVVEGALVRIPNYSCTFDFSLPEASTFACLAETYLFARDGLTEHSVGRASPELSIHLDSLARRYGVETSPLNIWIKPKQKDGGQPI